MPGAPHWELLPFEGILPGPKQGKSLWDESTWAIPLEVIGGNQPVDPRQAPATTIQAMGATTSTEVEEEEETETEVEEDSPPMTPSMAHSDGDSDVEVYTLATADTWAGEEYLSAGGEYAPTPVRLTHEFIKVEVVVTLCA
ncbi:MAG: hypothetical protein GY696_05645 [Gammaproteobacteria bacterium]|nr:hypothetical protein [Gammaproteobacteria bacterium]